jgi:hypothetical protein
MKTNSLETFIENVSAVWGPLSSDLAAACRRQLEMLALTSPREEWLERLLQNAPASEELYRSPEHGFILLAHTEQKGLYRPPHDHGRSWVVYAIQSGEIEMCSYARIEAPSGALQLVKRDSQTLRAGDVKIYLPGDIHDTRCLSQTALLFRFTERDLKEADDLDHRVTRYLHQDGVWTAWS